MFDVIIIGAGPAGLTAGIFSSRAGLKTLILEKLGIGGQVAISHDIANYPAFNSISGFDLADKMAKQAELNGAKILFENVIGLKKINNSFEIRTNNKTFSAKKVILACGNRARKLGLKNEVELIGHGVSYCASCDGGFFKSRPVAVIGGGDSAVEYVQYLTRLSSKVYLINRSDKFRAGERKINEIKKLKNVEIITNAQIKELKGKESLEEISLDIIGKNKNLKVDGLFVAIGHEPDLSFLEMEVDRDSLGYIIVDNNMRTNVKNLFAAGDIVSKEFKQVITACADGAIAGNSCIGEK